VKTGTSTKKNYLYSILYTILTSILPLVTSPYIARTIGATGLGIYSYSYSVTHYFAIFILLGLANYGSRAVASIRDDKEKLSRTFWEIYFMQLSLAVLMILAYAVYLLCIREAGDIVNLLMMIYLVSVALDINWFFHGMEVFKLTVVRNAVIKILTVACIFIFVKDAGDVWIYTLIMVLGFLFSQVALWPYLRRYVRFVLPKPRDVVRHIKPNLVLFIPVVAINVYKYMDKIMLGIMVDKTQVGYYENAEKVILIPMGFITAFGNVMMPKVSNLVARHEEKRAESYLGISFHFVTVLTLAMAFGLAAVSTKFSVLFWGPSFSVSGTLIAILAISMIFIAWPRVIITQYLIPKHREIYYNISVIIGAVVNFVANFFLIRQIQAAGAAWGTVLAECSVCIFQVIIVWRALRMQKILRDNVLFLIPGIVMYIGVWLLDRALPTRIWALILEIAAGVVIYGILLLLFEWLLNRELLMKMIRRYNPFGKRAGAKRVVSVLPGAEELPQDHPEQPGDGTGELPAAVSGQTQESDRHD